MMTMTTQATLRATQAVTPETFDRIRRQMVLSHHKWDPQVGDAATLAPFTVVLSQSAWQELAASAEMLAAETAAAENELIQRPDLWRSLGISFRMRRLLAAGRRKGFTPSAGRVMRFDFHLTSAGWRISEVNSDVPGGYTEAWNLSRLMADAIDDSLTPAGNPGACLADAIATHARGNLIGLLSAPGYLEDRQVVMEIGSQLEVRGAETRCIGLRELEWQEGRAFAREYGRSRELGAIIRFYQAEWLAGSPRRKHWQPLFVGGKTPVTNPPLAMLTESKGFPLTWDALLTELPTWRLLLPRTQAVSDIDWRHDRHWLLKGKYSNNGDEVIFAERASPEVLKKVSRSVFWNPNAWVVQRRFETLPLETPAGDLFPCVGLFVIDGKAAGIYTRLARGPLVDYGAMDAATLIERGEGE